jgi:hypothetical protein
MGSTWGQPGVNLGSTLGQPVPPYRDGDVLGRDVEDFGHPRSVAAQLAIEIKV